MTKYETGPNNDGDRFMGVDIDPALAAVIEQRIRVADTFINHLSLDDQVYPGIIADKHYLLTGPGDERDVLSTARRFQVYSSGVKNIVEVDAAVPAHIRIFRQDTDGLPREIRKPCVADFVSQVVDEERTHWGIKKLVSPELLETIAPESRPYLSMLRWIKNHLSD